MSLLSSLALATLGSILPALAVRPESAVDYAAFAVLGAVLFRLVSEFRVRRA